MLLVFCFVAFVRPRHSPVSLRKTMKFTDLNDNDNDNDNDSDSDNDNNSVPGRLSS